MQTINGNSKIMLLGFDGATFDIIDPMIDAGRLPNLKSIMQRGVRGTLQSTLPPLSPVAWSSFITGTNPGKHGIFDFFAVKPNSYQFQVVDATHRKSRSLWSVATGLDKASIVVNVPITYPIEKVNGVMISGLGTPAPRNNFMYPPELFQEIEAKVGPYILNPDFITSSDPANPNYLESMMQVIASQTRAVYHLMETRKWDLFVYVCTAPDEIQHACWKYMDKTHPDFEADLHSDFGDYIFRIYETMDAILGQALNRIDADTTIMIMSDHGHGQLYRNFFINNWLKNENYLCFNSGYRREIKFSLINLLRRFSDSFLLPFGMTTSNKMLKKIMTRLRATILGFSSAHFEENIDWDKTTAFCEGSFPAIYINSKKRFPKGCVEAGEEYERLRDEIINKLTQVKDPQNGQRVVETVYKPDDIYHGSQVDMAPDLICVLKDGYHGGGEMEQVYFGLQSEDLYGSHRWSSQHRMDGIFVAAGPHIVPGTITTRARIIDLAPTMLYQMGLPIPASMDGRVLEEIFQKDYLVTHERKYVEDRNINTERQLQPALSDSDSESVKDRLRQLGYIE
jgi:predicted AlkP superfamily phosphohydrolase/phosphomutase